MEGLALDFHHKEFWNKEYSAEGSIGAETFEWYGLDISDVWPLVQKAIDAVGVQASKVNT